ncbi:very short patch repair endonuclease [Rhizobium sp. WSM4643]|uniref:very short patch repair endonuclease n=1 Tax=Rhizobium sp. WSM4643 TaxID=3138253 RepID=UPI003F881C5B
MARVGQKNTLPEVKVRKILHGLGYRYRIHRRDLPGSPDIVFPTRRKAIFVHGCFWHRHADCSKATSPKTRVEFWREKFAKNVERDKRKERELRELGWEVETIWECETKDMEGLARRVVFWLGSRSPDQAKKYGDEANVKSS